MQCFFLQICIFSFCYCALFHSVNMHHSANMHCSILQICIFSFCYYALFHSANMHCFILQICIISLYLLTESEKYKSAEKLRSFLVSGEYVQFHSQHSVNTRSFILNIQWIHAVSFSAFSEYTQFHSQRSVNTRSFILSVLWRCTVFFSTVTHSNISSNSNISALLTTYFRNELVYEYRGPGGLVWWKK